MTTADRNGTSDPRPGDDWRDASRDPSPLDGYPDWDGSRRRDASHFLLFVCLDEARDVETLEQAIERTRDLDRAFIQADERAALEAEMILLARFREGEFNPCDPGLEPPARSEPFPWTVRVALYWPIDEAEALPPFWTLLHVGRPAGIGDLEQLQQAELPSPAIDPIPKGKSFGGPVAAVIDDGIAYAHRRFRSRPGATRIEAIWLQAERRLSPANRFVGAILERGDIDAELASGATEETIYRERNAAFLPIDHRRGTDHRAAHGTHVLDRAAGADPGEPMSRVPILAVQLPPASIADTSGRTFEGYVALGLRWIATQALLRLCKGRGCPLIVNLSLGSLAGPGDETAFLAAWMDAEAARYRRIAGGAPLRIVVAYGNARLQRLVARQPVSAPAPVKLDWRVQPDDLSDSFLELRAPATRAADMTLALVAPGAGIPPLLRPWPMPGARFELWRGGRRIAAVYGIDEAGPPPGGGGYPAGPETPGLEAGCPCLLVLIALAPSRDLDGRPVVPAGAWRVGVETRRGDRSLVTAKVQRDDTPGGFRTYGRQSWLDAPDGWAWDEDLGAFDRPAAGNPVAREGTAVAYAGARDPAIWFVGAARPATGAPDVLVPSRYSAAGVEALGREGESRGPDAAALADDGAFRGGVLAAGVRSGTVTRLSGTSAAAPLVVRRLIGLFLDGSARPGDPDADRDALIGGPRPRIDPRLGYGVIR